VEAVPAWSVFPNKLKKVIYTGRDGGSVQGRCIANAMTIDVAGCNRPTCIQKVPEKTDHREK
jgi:hypothetical protein